MNVEDRMQRILLLEKMNEDKEFSKQIGLKDVSTFKGKFVDSDFEKNPKIS